MRKEFYFPSHDGLTQIHALEWIPEGEIKAALQITHGMVEHIERYDDFAKYMATNGIYVTGHSHLGHGKSITGPENIGFFAAPNGNECVIEDMHRLRKLTQEKYPHVPYFMLGHSMGSFLLRQYLGIYSEGLSGAVIMGSADQQDGAVKAGKMICKLLGAVRGWKYRSNLVNGIVMGSLEKPYGKGWLSQNEENVRIYGEDPLCGFVFTLNAFYHMFDGMCKMNAQEKAGNIPKELPMFFVAGSDDPVGDRGKGVETVYHRYQEKGAKNVEMKLYEGDRHEILNELDKENVYGDILAWMKKNI